MERRAVWVRGIVQGVGFRPFVYTLATRFGLTGLVRNQSGAVVIEVEGEAAALDEFLRVVQESPPPLARIDDLSWQTQPLVGGGGFSIEPSQADATGGIFVSPDIATCDECLAELFDPRNRRYRYPFLNCVNCGPRLTIIRGAPYDRARTTMAPFAMCRACRAEYDDPSNRRFHAEPTACPDCGPRLELWYADGRSCDAADPMKLFVAAIRQGQIGALKGLGGYHLVCDATASSTVEELRRRKQRDQRALAIMVRDGAAAERLCHVNPLERELLTSPRRPIVLLRRRSEAVDRAVCDAVAPENPYLGVMLPYTPLHHLIMRAAGDLPLVMTSGNRSDEPMAYRDDDARQRLSNIADLFLTHNRVIHVRCDDSVTRLVDGVELPIRRSRGDAPQPIRLPTTCRRPILAVGGQFKNVFALGRERQALLSHHLGDLDHFEAQRAFEPDIELYQQLFQIEPQLVAHDLHPDYASTQFARRYADRTAKPLLAVQHHHAHMASCMAENGLTETVIGVSLDGTGFGTDRIAGQATIWGGEFLVGDLRRFRRAAHFRYVGLPGGDQAVRQPWRMALSHLIDAGLDETSLDGRIPSSATRTVRTMLERNFNSPRTSSAGRLFDAVASLAGIGDTVSYEGQAAMRCEWLATPLDEDGQYPVEYEVNESSAEPPIVIDTRPMIRAVWADVRRGVAAARIARRFHTTLVGVIAEACERIRRETQINTVVLSGGVFLNALLTREVPVRLARAGFRVYRHRLVPPSDAGLSLGQLAVAAAVSAETVLET